MWRKSSTSQMLAFEPFDIFNRTNGEKRRLKGQQEDQRLSHQKRVISDRQQRYTVPNTSRSTQHGGLRAVLSLKRRWSSRYVEVGRGTGRKNR